MQAVHTLVTLSRQAKDQANRAVIAEAHSGRVQQETIVHRYRRARRRLLGPFSLPPLPLAGRF